MNGSSESLGPRFESWRAHHFQQLVEKLCFSAAGIDWPATLGRNATSGAKDSNKTKAVSVPQTVGYDEYDA